MDHNVKQANKRLLKTMGFAIRMPISEDLELNNNITTKIATNIKNNIRRNTF